MFRPNQSCTILRASGKTDVFGQPKPSTRHPERCAVIRLDIVSEKSSVRADTSASRGSAHELEAKAELLLTKNTLAAIDDLIECSGVTLRVVSKFPRHDLQGKLDHYQITCTYWGQT